MSQHARKVKPAGITSDEMRAIDVAGHHLADAADELLKDLCARFGRNRGDLDGIPLRLDLAIKRMREVLL